ncbi:unnamed protein product [Prunus armeniaca]
MSLLFPHEVETMVDCLTAFPMHNSYKMWIGEKGWRCNMSNLFSQKRQKNNLSASWKVIGEKTSITDKINFTAVDSRQETPKVKVDVSSCGDHAQLVDPAKLARRQLREKRREKRANELELSYTGFLQQPCQHPIENIVLLLQIPRPWKWI